MTKYKPEFYKTKYLKYKTKYINLLGGMGRDPYCKNRKGLFYEGDDQYICHHYKNQIKGNCYFYKGDELIDCKDTQIKRLKAQPESLKKAHIGWTKRLDRIKQEERDFFREAAERRDRINEMRDINRRRELARMGERSSTPTSVG